MGILIRQEKQKWVIEIQEDWNVFNEEDATDLKNFLMANKIYFKMYPIYGQYNYMVFEFNNTKIDFEEFGHMKTILSYLLDYKRKFVRG